MWSLVCTAWPSVCSTEQTLHPVCVGTWWAVCVISWCRQDSNDIRSQHNPLDKMDNLGTKAIADQRTANI